MEESENNKTVNKTGIQFPKQKSAKVDELLPKSHRKLNLKSLDDYINNKSDYEIYLELTNERFKSYKIFEPLNFFHLFYKNVNLIENNKNKPTFIIQQLESLDLTEKQTIFLLQKLLSYFSKETKNDEQIDICYSEILNLVSKINTKNVIVPGNAGDPKPAGYASKRIEEKDLDDYLNDELDLIIYQDLTEGNNKDVFRNSIDFFRLFNEQVDFIGENICKPHTIIKNLKQLPITEKQSRLLLYYLNYLLNRVDGGNPKGEMKICQKLIETELNKLDEKLSPDIAAQPEIIKIAENYFQFDFVSVKEFLRTLEGYDVKIGYLIEAKTEYEQQKTEFNFESNKFDEKCELEINKFTRLKQMNVEDGQENNIIREHKGKILKTHDDLTKDRAILFMDYLLNKAGASSFKTAKAEVIFFLTGFDAEAVRQRLSSIYTNKDKKDSTYKDDLRKVRNLFNKLGLSEIIKKIDDEIERQ